MTIDHDELIARTIKGLGDLAKEIEKAPNPIRKSYRMPFSDLATLEKDKLKKELRQFFDLKGRAIYSIKLDDQTNSRNVRNALKLARASEVEGRAFSRVHPFRQSAFMYVGSSSNIAARLLGHLGFGAESTYSLHLKSWVTDLSGGFTIDVLFYPEISQDVLCALEDQLSLDAKPMFGRRGSV